MPMTTLLGACITYLRAHACLRPCMDVSTTFNARRAAHRILDD